VRFVRLLRRGTILVLLGFVAVFSNDAAASVGMVTLNWSPSPDKDVVAYNVYRSMSSGFPPATANRIGQTSTTTYTDTSFSVAGTYYYVVTSQDSSGLTSVPTNQVAAVITLDTISPTVSLSSPVAGATVAGTVTVTASAADNVAVAGVQFLLDGANLGAEVAGPRSSYTFSWNTATASNGAHTLSARARDGAGNTALSANVKVTVANAASSGGGSNGLVAAYSFNEGKGTTVSDSSGNNLTGTISGATWTTSGVYGGALSFNGSTSYVDLGNPSALRLTGSMTLEAWVKAAANPADDGQIIAKSNGHGWQLKTSPDTGAETFGTLVSSTSGTDTQRYSKTVRSLNTWYHVASVYDAASKTLNTYVNGVLDSGTLKGAVPASQLDSSVNVNIGRRTNGFYFNGVIDEVRIYNRDLSQAEIQMDMFTAVGLTTVSTDKTPPTVSISAPAAGAKVSGTVTVSASASDNVGVAGVQFLLDGANLGAEVTGSGPTYTTTWNTTTATNGTHTISARARDAAGNTSTAANISVTVSNTVAAAGPVAAYSFNQGSGTTAADISGNGLTGTLAGATWTTSGHHGDALSFNGTTSYVDLGNPALLNGTGSMTWAAWVYATGNPPDDGQIIAKADGSSGWQLKTSPDTGPETFGVKVSGSTTSAQRYSKTVRALNQWYHVTGVYNATTRTLDIYVNGVLDDGVLLGTIPSSQAVANLNVNIARRSGGFYFKGVIDDVRIYNRALSQTEIQAIMNTPVQ
jgi:Concanavalin A-like lectin/glucanases superfamily/Bacterial Ig domain